MGMKTVIGVRVPPSLRADIKQVALRHFDGNESDLLREGARLYIALRHKFGVQYEPFVATLIGDEDEPEGAAA
jgi:hypothetical protein